MRGPAALFEWVLGPCFSPLDFGQRFTGTFSQDGNTIEGAWEKRDRKDSKDEGWTHDFTLVYRRAATGQSAS